ncbi:hypothetical protein BZA77DRAFT_294829 [Pyronema omphalodes]|nr:hypothetical protein BZA77DRAFT_294829 [Pyronema omphalodes]
MHVGTSDLENSFPNLNIGKDCEQFRYGGPRKANSKIIEKASLVRRPATNRTIFDLYYDVLYLCFQYMDADDLKNMSLVCKKISQHTLRYMYQHLTWVLRERRVPGPLPKNLTKIRETIKVDMSRCITKQSLMMLRNMTSITNLVIVFRLHPKSARMNFTSEDFQRLYGDTLLPKLKELSIAPLTMKDLQGILSKAKSLERMKIVLPGRSPVFHNFPEQDLRQCRGDCIHALTIAKQLKELSIYHQTLAARDWSYTIPCLHNKNLWSQLKVVLYENIWNPVALFEYDLVDSRSDYLTAVYRQHVLHGGYDVKFTEPLEMRFSDLRKLQCADEAQIQQARELIHWLSGVNGPNADDLFLFTSDRRTLLSTDSLEELDDVERRLSLCYWKPIKFRLDASGLAKPPDIPYVFNDEKLCTANQHLSWINVPQYFPSRHRTLNRLMLMNLRELTLRNLFIHSTAEFEWFMSLTTLKKLEKLRIDGLVWHRGFHRWAYVYRWVYVIKEDVQDTKDYYSWNRKINRIPDIWDEKAWDCDGEDAKSAHSTDSHFGVDIRFSHRIDEELRIERLQRWITEQLLAEARRFPWDVFAEGAYLLHKLNGIQMGLKEVSLTDVIGTKGQ